MNKTIARINSKLYFDLWDNGFEVSGDKLLAVYCILLSSRGGQSKYYSYTSKNNKKVSGFSLLRAKTNLSVSVIQKYVPILIKMGLCNIEDNGNFFILGGNKIRENYNLTLDKQKLVPIRIGKNLTETVTYVMSVRIESKKREQLRMVEIKKFRSEIQSKTNSFNNDIRRKAKYYEQRFGEIKITEATLLSNKGFACLKDGSIDNKQKGVYWKNKMVKMGLITTKRRFQKLKPITYADFLFAKHNGYLNNTITFKNGYLVRELVSSFRTIDLVNGVIAEDKIIKEVKVKNKVKPLQHLSFDWVAWSINEE